MKPEDLKCFKEVADVIGHEGAVKELQVVIDTVEDPSHIIPDTSSLIECFDWRDTPQSGGFWANILQRVVPEPYNSSGGVWEEPNNPDSTLEEISKKVKDELVEQIRSETPVSSDGKASSYYWIELPLSERVVVDTEKGVVGFMVEEIIEHALDNDFDRGNIMKANLRVGKKSGNSVEYDTNKIQYSAERLKQRNESN